MNRIEWQELAGQFLAGAVYGFLVSVAATDSFTQQAWMTIGVAILKTGAQQALRLFQPMTMREGKQYKRVHWTEKFERML